MGAAGGSRPGGFGRYLIVGIATSLSLGALAPFASAGLRMRSEPQLSPVSGGSRLASSSSDGASPLGTITTSPGALHPVPTPSWWQGTCDGRRDPGSYAGAIWKPMGLIACAPAGTGRVTEEKPLYPNIEWQCVELAERWLYQEFAVPVQNNTDGYQVVNHYWSYIKAHPKYPLTKVLPGGTSHPIPGPGDVISYGTSDPGHVAVVIASQITDPSTGTGYYKIIQENRANITKLSIDHWIPAGEYNFEGAYMKATGWLHFTGATTMIKPGSGYLHPADPVCTDNGLAQGITHLSVSGSFYPSGETLALHTDAVFLGYRTVADDGTWHLTFPIPSRPDGTYPVTVYNGAVQVASLSFLSEGYTCWQFAGSTWTWDAVGWDKYSPMTFYIDGNQVDYWSASADGAMPARTFSYSCSVGSSHTWEVTGMRDGVPPGGLGQAGGSFSC